MIDSTTMGRTRAVGPLICALAMSACSGPEEDDPIPPGLELRFQSEHFDYYAAPTDDTVCSATVEHLEAHFSVLVPYLGLSWPDARTIAYYKARDEDVAAKCGGAAAGCVIRGNVYTAAPVHPHEVIHAYLDVAGHPPRIFEEGAAVLLSAYGGVQDAVGVDERVHALTWQELLAWRGEPIDDDAYYAAGVRLVDTLVQREGVERFVQAYAALDRARDARAADTALQATYSLTFEEAWAATLERPFEPPPSRTPFECTSSPSLDEEPTARVTGPPCGYMSQYGASVHFSMAADALVAVTAVGSGFFDLEACDSERPIPGVVPAAQQNGAGQVWLAGLAAGRYYVHSLPDDSITFGLDRAPTGVSSECAEAEAMPLQSAEGVVVSLPSSFPATYVALDVPDAYALHGYEQQNPDQSGASHARVCPSCADLTACEPVGVNDYGHRFGGSGPYVLVVEPDAVQPWPFVSVRLEIRAEP